MLYVDIFSCDLSLFSLSPPSLSFFLSLSIFIIFPFLSFAFALPCFALALLCFLPTCLLGCLLAWLLSLPLPPPFPLQMRLFDHSFAVSM